MKRIEIGTINNGAAAELFDRELKAVMKNIDDASTLSVKPRKITMEFVFTPNEAREMGVVNIQAKSTLAPAMAAGSAFIMVDDGRGPMPWEPNQFQPGLKFDENTIDIKSKQAGDYE